MGCGWLGLPLSQLLKEKGNTILGTTTSPAKLPILEKQGVNAFLVDLKTKEALPSALFTCDVMVLAFPPKTKSSQTEWYWEAVEHIMQKANESGIKKLILLSSTSVYPEKEMEMSEELILTEENTGHLAIYKGEQSVLRSPHLKTFVLRLGGLAGYDRLLARHFAGRKNLEGGNNPVNLLHRDDAVKIITSFIEKEYAPGIYNVCSPVHPTRKELYVHDCKKYGLPAPEFLETGEGKTISSKKVQKMGYTFEFADPYDYFYLVDRS